MFSSTPSLLYSRLTHFPRTRVIRGSVTRHRAVGGPLPNLGNFLRHDDRQGAGLLDFGEQILLRNDPPLGVSGIHRGNDGLLDLGAGKSIGRVGKRIELESLRFKTALQQVDLENLSSVLSGWQIDKKDFVEAALAHHF